MKSNFEKQFEEIFDKEKRVLIHGVPGVGKTRFCYGYCEKKELMYVGMDCEYEYSVIEKLREISKEKDFFKQFCTVCGIMNVKEKDLTVIIENADCSAVMCEEIIPVLMKLKVKLIITMRVINNATRPLTEIIKRLVMRPRSFNEAFSDLSINNDDSILRGHLKSGSKFPGMVHDNFRHLLEDYLVMGGMPYCLSLYDRSVMYEEEMKSGHESGRLYVLEKIIEYSDLSDTEILRVRQVINAVFEQMLQGDYHKFVVGKIRNGVTYSQYKPAIDFLVKNNILYKIASREDENHFILYYYDCGVLFDRLLQLSNKGKMTDRGEHIYYMAKRCFAVTELAGLGIVPQYWKSRHNAYIDLIFEIDGREFVCSIPRGKDLRGRALYTYADALKPDDNTVFIRLSEENINFGERYFNIPLYAISCIGDLK